MIFLSAATCRLYSQSGSSGAFTSLNLVMPSRIAAAGGVPLSINDNDLNLALYNPALIKPDHHNRLSFGFTDYFADIFAGYAGWSGTFDKIGSLTAAVYYLNYGTFTHTDFTGNILGEFKASDQALQIGWGRDLHPSFRMGANARFVWSTLEKYTSTAVAIDLASSYHSSDSLTSVSFIARNLGRQITNYAGGPREDLDQQAMISLSHKLEKAPLRLHFVVTHLERWDLTYTDPNNSKPLLDPLTGEKLPERRVAGFADKLARHMVAGASFVPSQNFYLSFGYNYLRRQEMKVESRPAMIGFSWGMGLQIKTFQISYARAAYHLSGAANHFTVSTSIGAR